MAGTSYLTDAERLITEAWKQPLDQLRASAASDPVLTGILRLHQALTTLTRTITNQQAGLRRLTNPDHHLDTEALHHLSRHNEQLRLAHGQADAYLNAIATLLNAFPKGYLAELHLLRTHHLTNTPTTVTTN
ncbi:hypothetical protein OG897_36595 [Streptomyces sp. NBC_00237]|uniref:hypothetical protein n=1 Tax=Streptomyces sp. NBC_00237 TaxID=2975687 RepID=UPI002250FB9A|nr:hypothetical protein [Streptomyces sp. NBC_00237]MCX5206908.1 hypothetical protein [Streptomyces sp. NBC_00237]